MSQIEETSRRKSNNHSSAKTLRVDLTPMVDLGFLLITFFILTTAMSDPMVAKLIMPKDSPDHTPVKKNAVLTLMLMRNDSIGYYEGDVPPNGGIKYCSFIDLRKVIEQKQLKVAGILGNRNETVIIISPGKESSYKNLVNTLDEIVINDIQHYYIVDEEKSL